MVVMRSRITSLIDVVVEQSATQGDNQAYTFLEGGERESARLTWMDVHRRSCAVAAVIQDRAPRGSRVLLLCRPGLEFIPAFFGCVYAGAIAVPAYPPTGARADAGATRLRGMVLDAGVTLVLTTSVVSANARALAGVIPELNGCQWLNIDEITASAGEQWQRPQIVAEDLAFLQYTSGSTTSPRGVMVSHANLLHNLSYAAQLGAYGKASVAVSWLPVNHDMGLIQGLLQPAFCGFPAWLMSPAAFLQRPARWLEAISRLRATHSGGPNFAYDLAVRRVTDDERAAIDLNSWRVAFNGSEPVRQRTLAAFHRRFASSGFQWNAFRAAYGLAESTLLVTATPSQTGPVFVTVDEAAFRSGVIVERPRLAGVERHAQNVTLVSSGSKDAGVHLEIVDPVRHVRVPRNHVGEIWISSASVACGYWQNPAETSDVFAAYLKTGEGPFLRTGDLGFVHDGQLFVAGRLKDVLIVRGLKHFPQDLELTVERVDAALRAGGSAVFAIDRSDERVAAVAEIDARKLDSPSAFDDVIRRIRIAVADVHGVQLSVVALLPPGAVPKTTSGKLQRYACREVLASGLLPVLAMWTADDVSFTHQDERIAS
jgi:acyl-CoA synthetase (AMP-forming)/AMP-acid ligase II